ncbi:helix-turn-helix domain-containing protein [bacterium SCSIO 12643]|nr:helix-turn-helix domain-containing protein [bacterium SCSIO 12643]
MKHISVIVPNGEAVLSSIIGAYKIFNKVNDYLLQTGQISSDMFKVDLVGLNSKTDLYNGAFTVTPNKTIDQIERTDLIIVTTIVGDMQKELANNAEFIPWIKKQRIQNDAEVASLCTGAFLLAETGLLNGKTCTTHWFAADNFRQMYPQITLLNERIITEDNGIYTSGGAYSFLNLLLYLVEKYCGRQTAIWCSKMFEIEFDRSNQNQFTIFNGQKEHEDESIKNAQTFIEGHFGDKINVEELANKFALSRRNFVRRFKKATSNTPIEYIQRVKIEAAKKSLESSTYSVSDVMYNVGYTDDKSFRNTFKKFTGLSPMEYRKKYNREMSLL